MSKPNKNSIGLYNLVCTICNKEYECKNHWKTMCIDCYKIDKYPSKFHRCTYCNVVCSTKYDNCYNCKDEVELQFVDSE